MQNMQNLKKYDKLCSVEKWMEAPPIDWILVWARYDPEREARLTNTFTSPARARLSSLSFRSGFGVNLKFALILDSTEGRAISHSVDLT